VGIVYLRAHCSAFLLNAFFRLSGKAPPEYGDSDLVSRVPVRR